MISVTCWFMVTTRFGGASNVVVTPQFFTVYGNPSLFAAALSPVAVVAPSEEEEQAVRASGSSTAAAMSAGVRRDMARPLRGISASPGRCEKAAGQFLTSGPPSGATSSAGESSAWEGARSQWRDRAGFAPASWFLLP